MLLNVLKTGNMPHCLFFGPPGTGKTSAALALCSQLFGQGNLKRRVLELNASDDRGIIVVREKIKTWTRTLVGLSGFTSNPNGDVTRTSAVDWKVVILDEADMMTPDAQSALRRIMEDNAKTTRFIIICNYVSRIIDPIASRCAKYRFEPIGWSAQMGRLAHIAQAEGLPTEDKALEAILRISEGDLRVSIMLLQSAATLLEDGVALTSDTVQAVAGAPPIEVSESLLHAAMHTAPTTSKTLLTLQEDITANGWDVNQILRQLLRLVISHESIPDTAKALIISEIATAQFRLTQGASEPLQLLEVITAVSRQATGMVSCPV